MYLFHVCFTGLHFVSWETILAPRLTFAFLFGGICLKKKHICGFFLTFTFNSCWIMRFHATYLATYTVSVKLCTAKLRIENQNKTYRDQSYPKAFPQIHKRESNFPCSLAQITPDNKQRFNTHSVSLARA